MCDSKILAEMVNQANYAAMSYNELVTLNFAYLLAEGDIKPLIEKKRAEEMERHTDEFVKLMDNYGASKDELLALIVKKALRDKPYGPTRSQNVDEPTPTANTEDYQDNGKTVLALPAPSLDVEEQTQTVDTEDYQDNGESTLALPEYSLNTVDNVKDVEVSNSSDAIDEQETEGTKTEKTISLDATGKTFVEETVEIMKTLSLPSYIEPQEPYYITCDFSCGDNGEFGHSDPLGENMSRKDLEDYRVAYEKFIRLFEKKKVIASTDDYIAYIDGNETYTVSIYHFPEEKGCGRDRFDTPPGSYVNMTENEIRDLQRKNNLLKKAIKKAKEYSFSDETDINTPFYDRYKFSTRLSTRVDLLGDRCRCYEDTSILSELMPAFETYATLFKNRRCVVLAKDNCVAAMDYETIYLVLFNIPGQKKKVAANKKKGKDTQKTNPVTKEDPAPAVNPLILKAVEITKSQLVGNGMDVNAPYFIQCDFSVMGDGELFQKGKPFIKDVSGEDELGKLKRNHLRFAKTMKAVNPVSTERYTAYFWNEGKNLSVFYYNTKGLTAAA